MRTATEEAKRFCPLRGTTLAVQEATICYPVDGDRVLLIRKKRGVGSGNYNGPGGKLEDGETPREAARREVREEVRLWVEDLEKTGELAFVFGDEPFMHVHVFRTTSFSGTPKETPEADPEWFHREEIPYDEMWEDDRLWLPLALDGDSFVGYFRFDADGDEMRGAFVDRDVSF